MTDRDFEPDSNPLCMGDPLARELAQLQPWPVAMATPSFLYQAGQASQERTIVLWKRLFLGACVVGICGIVLMGMFSPDAREPQIVERVVYRERPAPVIEVAPIPRERRDESNDAPPMLARSSELTEYMRMRDAVLASGLDALPNPRNQASPTVTPAELERSLDLPRGVLTAPYRFPPKTNPLPQDE